MRTDIGICAEDLESDLPIDGFTASALGLENIVQQCIECGLDVNSQNLAGWTMLQYAAFVGHTTLVNSLIGLSADPNAGQLTPLMLAARCCNEPILVLLLNNGAKVEKVDNTGLTALQHAVNWGQEGAVRVLLRQSPAISSAEGNVLLHSEPHSAVSQAHKAVVRALLDGGIVPSPATRTSIVEIARSRGNDEIARMIMCAGSYQMSPAVFPGKQEDPFTTFLQKGPAEMQRMMSQARNPFRSLGPTAPGPTALPPFLSPSELGPRVMSPVSPAVQRMALPSSVKELLLTLRLEKYVGVFEKEDVDLPTFLTLTDSDLKSIGVDLLGPRKKILNHIKTLQSVELGHGELQRALLREQQNCLMAKEQLRVEREKDNKNLMMLQSLYQSFGLVGESREKLLTSLSSVTYIVQNIEQELVACKEVYDKLPRTDSLASSWPRVRQKEALVVEECDEEQHIALASVHSVLEGSGASPFKESQDKFKESDESWTSSKAGSHEGLGNSWDDCASGDSSSTLSASSLYKDSKLNDKIRKHLDSALIYMNSLSQHVTESRISANTLPRIGG